MQERVVWKGFVAKRDMIQALFDADILLYPSYHHGLATVILQAMYAKLPIVTIAGDPVAQVVAEGAGIVADGKSMPDILADLENKTLELVQSAELRRQYGENGRRLIAERYEWQVLVHQLSEHLQRISH